MTRLIMAMLGALIVLVGHDMHSPAAVVVGLVAVVPLLVKVLSLPAASRGAFALTAVAAGLALAMFAAGHHEPVQPRPVPAACVAGVHR